MCYYFGRTKSVCEARVLFEEGSEDAARLQRLRTFSPDENDEQETDEFGELLSFLRDCVQQR